MWLDDMRVWNGKAQEWVDFIRRDPEGGWARQSLLHPALFAMTGPLAGKAVLDAGCGEGYLARLMAEAGARVTAVDFAEALLEAARALEKETPRGIEYIKHSVTDLRSLADGRFDVIVCIFVLTMLEELEQAYRELARVLRPGGVLATAILHPCFDGVGSGQIDQGGERRWVANRYVAHVEGKQGLGATVHHRPISVYVRAAAEAGLRLSDLREPVADHELSRRLPPELRIYDRIPDALLLAHVKS